MGQPIAFPKTPQPTQVLNNPPSKPSQPIHKQAHTQTTTALAQTQHNLTTHTTHTLLCSYTHTTHTPIFIIPVLTHSTHTLIYILSVRTHTTHTHSSLFVHTHTHTHHTHTHNQAQIDHYHKLYCNSLSDLYERHKVVGGGCSPFLTLSLP